jgi:NAD(P)-dependent dehydrogenase (short-subunit alcohol dehydrogenase family)
MSGKLQNRVAVITGGTSGIGLACARLFVQDGAFVFITGRRQKELDDAVSSIGRDVVGVRGDVTSLEDLDRLHGTVRSKQGRIDVVFANAGVGEPGLLEQVTEAQYHRQVDTNVKGVLFTVQKALPLLSDGGSIILTGATSGSKGTPTSSVYGATKAAIRCFCAGVDRGTQGSPHPLQRHQPRPDGNGALPGKRAR